MNLSDLFPEAERLESVRRQMVPGYVFYLYCKFTTPEPKNKYLLLVCSEPLLFLVINSEKRDLVRSNKRWDDVQIPLLKQEYTFLDHDSWIDCVDSVPTDDMPRENVEQQVLADMTRIQEPRLTNDKMEAVMDAVANSPGFIPQDQSLIMAALSALY